MTRGGPTQRTTEWLDVTKAGRVAYHRRQFSEPYRSTIAFVRFLDECLTRPPARIVDIGCGEGANTFYLGRHFPGAELVGVDLNPDLVAWGNETIAALGGTNCHLEVGDLYDLDDRHSGAYDGVVCLQTLSWLPAFEAPLQAMAALRSEWVALSSLFYDGPVNTRIEIQDYTTPLDGKPFKETFYNIYSLPLVRELLHAEGFTQVETRPFEIDIDLPRPASPGMGTYTERLSDGRRLQVSGPLLMNWCFVFASRG
ncbi:MAG: class I SAM-dependent methyltransferase [Actinomycetota bacterium]|nr:class I SAM-dependent methyltransferase [Actinomycetota bacterium]